MSATARVVVAGAGFAGLEAAFLLRMRPDDRVHIHLVSDADRFVFRPNTIYIPFGPTPSRAWSSSTSPSAGATSRSHRGAVARSIPRRDR